MSFFSDSSRVINALLVLGLVVLAFAVLASGAAAWKYSRFFAGYGAIEPGTLGEQGVACGGPERLPCQPGFVCDVDDDELYGECVEDERETFPLGDEGQLCNSTRGCRAGLVCNAIGGASGVCVNPTAGQ